MYSHLIPGSSDSFGVWIGWAIWVSLLTLPSAVNAQDADRPSADVVDTDEQKEAYDVWDIYADMTLDDDGCVVTLKSKPNRGRENLGEKQAQALGKFTRLTELYLKSVRLHGRWNHINDLTALRDLTLVQTDFGIDEAELLPELTSLQSLAVTDCSDAYLYWVARLPNLEKLDVGRGLSITEKGVKRIAELDKLRVLVLGHASVTDDALPHIGGMTNLEQLHLDHTRISGESLQHLTKLKRLTELSVDDTEVSELRFISELEAVETLSLRRTKVKNGLDHLQKLPRLKTLILGGYWITDDAIAGLAGIPSVKVLQVETARISDAGLVTIGTMKNLEELRVYQSGEVSRRNEDITGPGIKYLRELTRLKIFHLSGRAVTDDALVHIGKLKGLTELWLNHTAITDERLDELGKVAELSALNLEGTKVTSDGVEKLMAIKGLRHLNLRQTRIDNVARVHLEQMPHLETLYLTTGTMTRESIGKLQSSLPNTRIHW